MTPETKTQTKAAAGTLAVVGAAFVAGLVAINVTVPPQKPAPSIRLEWSFGTDGDFWTEYSTTQIWGATSPAGPFTVLKTSLPARSRSVTLPVAAPYYQTNAEVWTNRRTHTGGIKTNVWLASQEFFVIEVTNSLMKTSVWNWRKN